MSFHNHRLLPGLGGKGAWGRTRDHMMTFDTRTIDSTGAFLVGELERLDPTLNEPLVDVTWSRDIQLREDVTIADEVASFTQSNFAALGGINPNGISWIGGNANAIAGVALDIGKTAQPMLLWGQEASWTIPELETAQKLNRPVDQQKIDVIRLKHNMDIDQMVYIGDSSVSRTGLVNGAAVTNVSNAPADGAGSSALWTAKTPQQILRDVNDLAMSVWTASGFAVVPNKLLLPPVQWGYIGIQPVTSAGDRSIMTYLRENYWGRNRGVELQIDSLKWLPGRGAGGTDRMVLYNDNRRFVQYPLVPLQRTPLQYASIYHKVTYYGRLGSVEFRYPETIGYRDGI